MLNTGKMPAVPACDVRAPTLALDLGSTPGTRVRSGGPSSLHLLLWPDHIDAHHEGPQHLWDHHAAVGLQLGGKSGRM